MSLEYNNDDEIIISNDQFWETPPCDRHPAICIDVVPFNDDMEITDKKTGNKISKPTTFVYLVFQVFPEDGTRDSKGQPFCTDVRYIADLGPTSWLRQRLERWRGQIINGGLEDRPFTNQELLGFNVAKLKGVPCWLSLIPNGNFVNVSDIEPYVDDSGKPIMPAPTPDAAAYQRRKYKKKDKSQGATVTQSNQTPNSSGSNANANDKSTWVPF